MLRTALALGLLVYAAPTFAQDAGVGPPATSAPTGVRADAAPSGDEALRSGVQLRVAGHDEDALVQFTLARTQCGCAEALAQRALAEQALGRWVAAEVDLDVAVSEGGAWIERNAGELREARALIATHLGTVEVRSNVPEARVRADARELGVLRAGEAVRARVEPGRVVVTVEAPGYVTALRVAQVESGSTARLEVALVPAREPPPDVVERPPNRGPQAPGRPLRSEVIWGLVATSAAAVFVGLGAGLQWYSQDQWLAYNDDARCLVGSRTRAANCGGVASAAWTAQGLAVGGFVLGAVAAAVATFEWWRVATPARAAPSVRHASPAVTCVVAVPPGIGIGCGARF